jgi:Na+/H+-dicarboxylate symporter
MNGAAIYQAMSAVFIAQAYGINLEWQTYATIAFAATLGSFGTAGVPGTGFIMLSMVFSIIGLPLEGIALLAGIDRLREMLSTIVNILGDAVVTVYISKKEGELNQQQYNQLETIAFE